MPFRDEIASISAAPDRVLTTRCVISLQAFLVGYGMVDGGIRPGLRAAALRLDGSNEFDVCTKAYLLSSNTGSALQRAVDAILAEFGSSQYPSSVGPCASGTFVDAVRPAIAQGRPGLAMQEPTSIWLADYAMGHIAGKSSIDPEAAVREREQLVGFEAWLRNHYGGESAPWYSLIRVYEGLCDRSLLQFLVYWDEYEKEAGNPPRLNA